MTRNKSPKPGRSSTAPLSSEMLKAANLPRRESKLRINPSSDVVKLSFGVRSTAQGIDFGSPSEKTGKASTSTRVDNHWSSLLQSVASGGISDVLGGGGLLSASLDYLSSAVSNLFGGGSEESVKPLVRFELPEAQDRTVYVAGSGGLSERPAATRSGGTSYETVPKSSEGSQTQKGEIIKTIKNALLTSSSLNDIIGEL